jgi:hypothetical protein
VILWVRESLQIAGCWLMTEWECIRFDVGFVLDLDGIRERSRQVLRCRRRGGTEAARMPQPALRLVWSTGKKTNHNQ